MYYSVNENNEIDGFYDEDYANLPEIVYSISKEDRDIAISYQEQGLVMCVTNGVITGEKRPNIYSVWSKKGKWKEDPEIKESNIKESLDTQITELKNKLNEIDFKSQRSQRAILLAVSLGEQPAESDINKLKELETQASDLRLQLSSM